MFGKKFGDKQLNGLLSNLVTLHSKEKLISYKIGDFTYSLVF